jgi:ABC-type polysaccharide/polyol phosphate export permease
MASGSIAALRFGWPAALVDAAAAAVCYALAYRLRFGAGEFAHFAPFAGRVFPLVVVLHVAVLAAAGVYSVRRALWPLRLVAGTVVAGALGLAAGIALFGAEGLSRQASAIYVLLLVLGGVSWRAALGLLGRWAVVRQPLPRGALEERGAHYRSMSGGVLFALSYAHLLRNLVAKDLKLKYRGSVLGFLWSLVNPITMVVVYTFAFTYVLRVPTEKYPFFVLLGTTAWGFFASAVSASTGSIADGGSLIKSVVFPRIILPTAGVLFAVVQYLLTVAVLLPIMLVWFSVPLGPQMLLFPVFLGLQILFIAGLALLLGTATAFLRDVKHLVDVGLSLAFWATPVLYEFSLVPERFRLAVLLSPMTSFVRAYQDIFFYLTWPDLSTWLVALTYGVGAFVCGLSVFVTYEDRFSEQV